MFNSIRSALSKVLVGLGLLSLFVAWSVSAGPGGAERPRVIVLGFDGVDHGMTQEYIARGELPNLAALAKRGSFTRLETTNPAESAVSWSTFGRGLDPGHTNMFGFVSRKEGTYQPELRFMKLGEKPIGEFYGDAGGNALPMALGGLALGALLGLLLGRGRARLLVATVLAAVGGAGGMLVGGGDSRPAGAPKTVPTLLPVIEGKALWDRLDDAGLRVRGFLVPMATPIEPMQLGKMTGGLGVPDVAGHAIGSYYLFSTSANDVPAGDTRTTASSGKVIRLRERDGELVGALPGPRNGARQQVVADRLTEIKAKTQSMETPFAERKALRAEQAELVAEQRAGFDTHVEVHVKRGTEPGSVSVRIADQTQVVAEGGWSGWMAFRFPLPEPLDAAALCRFRVVTAGDDIRLFFAPLGFDPRETPRHMCIEQPPGFGKQLAEDAGLFDTTGWACISNPLKDVEIGEDVFLEQIKMLTADRSRVLYSQLAKDDYDFYFAMFGETDRVQHLMFRLLDEKNPMYDAELAAKYGGAVLEAYQAMDEIVGEVMKRFVDERTHLLIVSDHGFTSFRRQMALNTWLIEEGYLVPKGGGRDVAALLRRLPDSQEDFLLYMDTGKSRAFALGLGKIYLNLKGREANGFVDPAEREALCKEITDKLLALRDPKTGDQVVQRVWRSQDLYTGPYVGTDADLTVGFAEYYRVSWSTTTGGLSANVLEDNDSKWSGDHASNDPDVVPGVLFSSRSVGPGQKPAIVDMAPTILGLLGVEPGMTDGRVLTFQ